jgi:hypothetical protein
MRVISPIVLLLTLACATPTAPTNQTPSMSSATGVVATLAAVCGTPKSYFCDFTVTLPPGTAFDHVDWFFGDGHGTLNKPKLTITYRYGDFPYTYTATAHVWFADSSFTAASTTVTIQ